jgi:hypothetical protein
LKVQHVLCKIIGYGIDVEGKGEFARAGAETQLRLSLFYINEMFRLVRGFV